MVTQTFLSIRTVVVLLAGFLSGLALSQVKTSFSEPAAPDRNTFSYLDWRIEDFETEFGAAYRELSEELSAELLAEHNYADRYHRWLSTQDPTAGTLENFERKVGPRPVIHAEKWIHLLEGTLHRVNKAYPVEVLELDLVRLYAAAGRTDRLEQMRSELSVRNPKHPAFAFCRRYFSAATNSPMKASEQSASSKNENELVP